MKHKPQAGDAVRVLSINGDPELVGPDAWGVVLSRGRDNIIEVVLLVSNDRSQPVKTWGAGWFLGPSEREFVLEDEVPDAVWAALAKWRLTSAG